MNPDKLLKVPQGEFYLDRIPHSDQLRAWDAADEFLLESVAEMSLPVGDTRLLVANDSFGSLVVALNNYNPTLLSDSYLSRQAMQENLKINKLSNDNIVFNNGMETPDTVYDLILIKIPRSLALLEHQLYVLRSMIHDDTKVIAAGMSRVIHKSTLELFEKILGPTTTSLARKKARLIYATRDKVLNEGKSPYPDSYILETDREYVISNHAGVFSRDRLDSGTRLMIENMPVSPAYQTIVDLGCGNGILGLVAASVNEQAKLIFSDESFMAIASARKNFEAAFGTGRDVEYNVTNGLLGVDSTSANLILNNPPFHQQNATDDAIAWQMFIDSKRVLKPGGEIWVVGNRHLAYHVSLKKIFGNYEHMASNRKFVILKAVKV